jgi:hypothetical protein
MVYEDGRYMTIHPNVNASHFEFINSQEKRFLSNQSIYRDESFTKEHAYLNNNLIPFMDWIVEKHSEYNPIVWSIFSNTTNHLNTSRLIWHNSPDFLKNLNNKLTIKKESNEMFNDGHYGRYGNYYMAVLFDEMIKSGITTNFDDTRNSSLIYYNSINRIKNENLIFTNPSDWPTYIKENIKENIAPANNFSNWITQKHKNWFNSI